MSMRFAFPADAGDKAAAAEAPRGASPVGYLHELPAAELAAVLYLRCWCEGGPSRDRIAGDFRQMLGEDAAGAALADFDALVETALRGARRPLMRHGIHCRCFGGDESAFANMIAAAVGQDPDDAMLFALTLMSAPAAFEVVRLAGALSQVFLRVARHAARARSPIGRTPPSSSTH